MSGLRFQLLNALLMILTVAAVISALINFQQQSRFRLPDDGVLWSERAGGVAALHVVSGGPAANVGLRTGDVVLKIAGVPIEKATDVASVLLRLGAWSKATYQVRRAGVDFETTLIVGQAPRDFPALYYQYLVGLAYLGIGLFVLLPPRARAQGAAFLRAVPGVVRAVHVPLHGKAQQLRQGDVLRATWWPGCWRPPFSCTSAWRFPSGAARCRRRLVSGLVYLPAALLLAVFLGVASGRVLIAIPPVELSWLLDRVWLGFLTGMYLAGRRCAEPGLPPRRGSDRAQAVEVAAQRGGVRDRTVRCLLRGSLLPRRGARDHT